MGATDWNEYAVTYRQIEREGRVPPLLAAYMTGRSGTLLDVGCGEGDLLGRLATEFPLWRLTGFEVSLFRADIARQRGHQVQVDVGGEIPEGEYDLIVSAHVIEHVEDDIDHARRLAALIAPGGHIYVETPMRLPGAWYFRRSPQGRWVLDPTHVREYRSVDALITALESGGLYVVTHEVVPLAFPFTAAVALLRRVLNLPVKDQRKAPAWSVRVPRYRVISLLARRAL